MTENKKGLLGNIGTSLFGFMGKIVGGSNDNGRTPVEKSIKTQQKEQKCIVVPEGRMRAFQTQDSSAVGFSELIKDRHKTNELQNRNRLHALELLYENENDDGKEKLEEIEAVQSIYEDPGDQINFDKMIKKPKKPKKKTKKDRERCSSEDSTHTI